MHARALVLTALGLFALTAVAGAQSELRVAVRLFQFSPGRLDVKTGTRVMWANDDQITHTVTSSTLEGPDGRFAFTLADKGASGSITLAQPGVYPYFCARHPHMRGEIRVQQPSRS